MRIPQSIYDELIAHANEDAPNECCGLIGGSDGSAETVYRAVNSEASPLRYNPARPPGASCFQAPRVKSGTSTGALPFETDAMLSGTTLLHAAAS